MSGALVLSPVAKKKVVLPGWTSSRIAKGVWASKKKASQGEIGRRLGCDVLAVDLVVANHVHDMPLVGHGKIWQAFEARQNLTMDTHHSGALYPYGGIQTLCQGVAGMPPPSSASKGPNFPHRLHATLLRSGGASVCSGICR